MMISQEDVLRELDSVIGYLEGEYNAVKEYQALVLQTREPVRIAYNEGQVYAYKKAIDRVNEMKGWILEVR